MQGTVKIWTTPQEYSRILEGKTPNEYWTVRPTNPNVVEMTIDVDTVRKWGSNLTELKVSTKKILFG